MIIDVSIVGQKPICNQCRIHRIVCVICERRFGFTKLSLVENHLKDIHPGVLPTYILQYFKKGSFRSSTSDHERRQSIIYNTSVAEDVSQSNMSDANKLYFTHDITEEGFGLQAFIVCAVTSNEYSHSYPKESIYHLNVTKFCEGLEHGQVVQF